MTEPIDTFEHAGYTIELYHDDDSGDSPRDWSNVGHMVCWHRRADLGDETISTEDFESAEELMQTFRDAGARVILPLWLYEHSGMTMRVGEANPFHDPWDSGQVGFIYDTPEGVKQCIGDDATDENIRACLVDEVEVYDQYLQGEVYGYVIEDEDGNHVGSLWGMYEDKGKWIGDDDGYVRREARSEAEGHAVERDAARAKERDEAAHWAARDTITVKA